MVNVRFSSFLSISSVEVRVPLTFGILPPSRDGGKTGLSLSIVRACAGLEGILPSSVRVPGGMTPNLSWEDFSGRLVRIFLPIVLMNLRVRFKFIGTA